MPCSCERKRNEVHPGGVDKKGLLQSVDVAVSLIRDGLPGVPVPDYVDENFSTKVVRIIPFGLFLSEFLASAKRFSVGRRLGLATLAGFGLSLCIECLQLLLRVGFFELTDLVMNTLGAFAGAGVAIIVRKVFVNRKGSTISNE